MDKMHKAWYWEEAQSFHVLTGRATLSASPCFQQPRNSLNSTHSEFQGGFIIYISMIDQLLGLQ